MTELPDEAWDEEYGYRRKRDYQSALMRHPHPADPDHPDPEEYGIFEDDEDE